MAKAQTARTNTGGGVVVVSAPPAPRRRRSISRAYQGAAVKAKRTARRVAGSYANAGLKPRMLGAAMGGFGVGIVEKTFGAKLPSLPYVGRKGAIALAVYFLQPKTKLLQDIGLAAAALSGYEFAKDGKVSGEDDDDDIFETA